MTLLRTKVVGHRGLPTSAPENTSASLRAAAAAGLTWTETDVQLTADGIPVIIHDDTVDRTTNGKGTVNNFTLAQLRAGSGWRGPRLAGSVPYIRTRS